MIREVIKECLKVKKVLKLYDKLSKREGYRDFENQEEAYCAVYGEEDLFFGMECWYEGLHPLAKWVFDRHAARRLRKLEKSSAKKQSRGGF